MKPQLSRLAASCRMGDCRLSFKTALELSCSDASELHIVPAMKVQLRKVSSLFCVCTKRRLLLGAVATLALGGFALVPTDYLRLVRPSKPLFLYLVPLLRVRVSPNVT